MKEIKAVLLTPENFKDYGRVIGSTQADPMAESEEFIYWGKVAELGMTEKISTGILICKKREGIIKSLERHVSTPEILVALEGDSYVCMARPDTDVGADQTEGIKAFYIHQGEALVMHARTWHWIPVPVNREDSKFLVVFASGTEADDLEVGDLKNPLKVRVT